jgi:hypothetical protein
MAGAMAGGTRALAWLVVAFAAAACHRGARDDQPLRTSSGGGSSASAPAAAAEGRKQALVRVVDAIPDAKPLDVFAGDTVAFAGLQYKAVTSYQELPRGTTRFHLRPARQDRAEPLANADEGLSGGEHYTIVAMPSRDGSPATLKVLKDELSSPPAGKARVRVVNASPDAGEVTIFVGGRTDAVVSSVGAAAASGFRDVDPIAGTLEVRRDKDKEVLARLPSTRLDAGGFYTVFLLGRMTGGLEAMLVEDQHGPAL